MHSQTCHLSPALQQLAQLQWYQQRMCWAKTPLSLREVGFRMYSQNEEDGILLYLLALVGMPTRRAVEMCCGDGIECNVANLVVNHGFHALMVDGERSNIEAGERFYSAHADTRYWPPRLVAAWVTAENCNQLASANCFDGEVDVLSIDVDGVDYWLWKALTIVRPRVVVIEINHLWGAVASVTVPYHPDFKGEFTEYGSDYAGASLAAMVKLGTQKGYRLVGTNRFATNAFFVRNDLEHPWLREVDPATCFDHPRTVFGRTVRWPKIKNKAWQEV